MTSTPAPETTPHTILIVDDTPANLGVVVESLEDYGLRVVIAQDGEEGLQRADFAQPDLILLDVMMPGMDGFETCRRLKARPGTRDIPVIFMTALAETKDKVTGFEAGAVDYVTKPLQVEEVIARVNTHLSLHAMQQQLEAQNTRLQQEIVERTQAERALEQTGGLSLRRIDPDKALSAVYAVWRMGKPRLFVTGQNCDARLTLVFTRMLVECKYKWR